MLGSRLGVEESGEYRCHNLTLVNKSFNVDEGRFTRIYSPKALALRK